MQGLAINLFAVRLAILPATKENPDPLESERSDNGVFRLAFCALLLVVGLGPRRGSNRVHGLLVKRLPQKLGTSPAPMHQCCTPGRESMIAKSGCWRVSVSICSSYELM